MNTNITQIPCFEKVNKEGFVYTNLTPVRNRLQAKKQKSNYLNFSRLVEIG